MACLPPLYLEFLLFCFHKKSSILHTIGNGMCLVYKMQQKLVVLAGMLHVSEGEGNVDLANLFETHPKKHNNNNAETFPFFVLFC